MGIDIWVIMIWKVIEQALCRSKAKPGGIYHYS
jgi:hypothetical protein